MECNIANNNQGLKVQISGQFTFADNQKFRRILDAVHQEPVESLEVDFSAVDFIDSAGLGMLLLLRDQCQNKNIALSIHAIHGQVEKIFTLSKFDQLFALHP